MNGQEQEVYITDTESCYRQTEEACTRRSPHDEPLRNTETYQWFQLRRIQLQLLEELNRSIYS